MRKKLMSHKKIFKKALPLVLGMGLFALPTGQAATYTVTNVNDLQSTINQTAYGDTIVLVNNGSNWVLNSGLTVSSQGGFTLDGRTVIVLGNNTFRLLDASNRELFSFENIELNQGYAGTGNGGAVLTNRLDGRIYNTAFRSNVANDSGGAVYIQNDFQGGIRTNIHFDRNRAVTGDGGGIYIGSNFSGGIVGENGDVHFDYNTAGRNGGGMYVGQSYNNGDITATYFAGNTAGQDGGGLYVGGNFGGNLAAYSFFVNNVAGQNGAGMYVNQDFNGQINGARFTGNNATSGSGGGLYVGGNFNSSISADFENNTAGLNGGAIIVTRDFNANINAGTTFISNRAANNGGAIYAGQNMNGSVQNATFSTNSATSGGAIYSANTLNSSFNTVTFQNNSAVGGSGGAIYTGGTISGNTANTDFIGNSATVSGGAIYLGQDMNGSIQGSRFTGNSAGTGGAVYTGSNINGTFDNVSFSSNNATAAGGALAAANEVRGNIINSNFANNTAAGNGGAISAGTNLNTNLQNTEFTGNQAATGGALYAANNVTGNLQSLDFSDNQATTGNGGAIAAGNDFATNVNQGTFSNNSAALDGGAIYVANNFSSSMNNNTFTNNTAGADGGAVSVVGTLNGSVINATFTNNQANLNGGAFSVGSLNGDFSGTTISNNRAGGLGGGLYIADNLNFSVAQGATTTIRDNIDSSGPKSMAFAGGNNTANFNIDGQLVMYDPVSSLSDIAVTKRGSGQMILGGSSVLGAGSSWTVDSGTMRITFDTQGNSFSLSGLDNFIQEVGTVLEIVPYATPAQILVNPGGMIDLNGNIHLVSDYRYAPQIQITENTVFLHLSQPHEDPGFIDQTSGTFDLGQYTYAYDGITWVRNDTDISFQNGQSWVNPDHSGGNNVDGSTNATIANKTSSMLFVHLDELLLAKDDPQKLNRNLWGTTFYNLTRTDPKFPSNGSSVEVPGFIIGHDFATGERSYMGGAVSAAWPKYKQGGFKDNGHEVRLSLYGGSYWQAGWKFGWLAAAGFGELKHSRIIENEYLTGRRNVRNYTLGLSFGKEIEYGKKNILHPFITYEYIMSRTEGFNEQGHSDYVLGTSGLHANISRLRSGLEYIRRDQGGSSVKFRVYYQGLYGDTCPSGSSYLLTAPHDPVVMSGSGLDRNAFGTGVTFIKAFNSLSSLKFEYDGLFASRSKSNNFSLTYEYKF